VERAVARIDLGAVRANCERLRAELGEARLCAVVKADGYGHGADAVAEAALAGGAAAFAVATAGEAKLIGRRFAHMPLLTLGSLTETEVEEGYEEATGAVLIEAVAEHGPIEMPCALVRGHAPFCWGRDAPAAVEAAVTLEEVARMAVFTTMLDADCPPLADAIRAKHYARKHGPQAYYGQP